MMAPTPWVFFQGGFFAIYWHVLRDVSQHDTTVGHNFSPDASVKPPHLNGFTTIHVKHRIGNNKEILEMVEIDPVTYKLRSYRIQYQVLNSLRWETVE